MRRLAARTLALLATTGGLTRRWRRKRHAAGDFRVFVLAYHDVTDGDEREGVVSTTRLRHQVRHLKKTCRIADLEEASSRLAAGETLGEDLVVLTFDDGYRDNFHLAKPLLEAEEATATIFLTTGFLDGQELWFDFARRALRALDQCPERLSELARQRLAEIEWWPGEAIEPAARRLKYLHPDRRQTILESLRQLRLDLEPPARAMSWDEARQMRAAGFGLGGHTVRHPILSTLSPGEQEEEIRACRNRITAELKTPPRTFAFPNGSPRDFDEHTLEALTRCGFTTCCAMIRGSNRPGCDRLQLRRIGVGHDPNFLLEARLAGLFDEEMRQRLGLRR